MIRKGHFTRLFAVIAAILLICCTVPLCASAQQIDLTGATRLTFSDGGITAADGSSTAYQIKGTTLTIDGAGTYVLSGTCADGSVTVKKGTTGVTLVLDGLTLTGKTTAPIACSKSTAVTIMAADGTVNTLADTEQNNDETHPENEAAENAVIKGKDGSQVTLCGTGTLKIEANGKNGIKSGETTDAEGEAWLKIRELTLSIAAAVNDGINAGATVEIESGKITVSAADDGIHSDYTLTIGASGTAGPTIDIEKSNEGLEAAQLTIASGTITVNADDDGLNAANKSLSDYAFSITIAGGTLKVSAGGDGLDSNGALTISGGDVTVYTSSKADDQPLDADGTISVAGGTVLAAGGSAGMGMKLNTTQPYVLFGSSDMGGMGGGRPGGGFGGRGDARSDTSGSGNAQSAQDTQSDRQPPDLPNGQGSGTQSGQQPSELPQGGQPGSDQLGDSQNAQQPPTPPDGQSGGGSGMPGGVGGSGVSVAKGSTFTIRDADGGTVLSTEAPFALTTVFYSSTDLTNGGSYTLLSGTDELAASTAASGESSTGSGAGRGDMQRPGTDSDKKSSSLLVICLIAAGVSLLVAVACVTVLIVVLHRRKKSTASTAAPAAAPTAPTDQSTDPKENG